MGIHSPIAAAAVFFAATAAVWVKDDIAAAITGLQGEGVLQLLGDGL